MFAKTFRAWLYIPVALLTVVVCLSTSAVGSDDARRAYGQGVHLYYQGRLTEAIQYFDIALSELPNDARIYYFRGLAKRRTGQSAAAQADFQLGASLEATHGGQNVGSALQRVQGYDRLEVERFRRDGRRLAQRLGSNNPSARTQASTERLPTPKSTTSRRPGSLAVSEIPGLSNLPSDARDPFAQGKGGLLGRGELEKPVHVDGSPEDPATVADAEISGDEPLGSGFDASSIGDEPFSDDFPDELGFDDANTSTAKKKRGVLGSVFRAVTRGAMPATPEQGQNLLQGIRNSIPLPGAAGGPQPGPADGSDSPADDFSSDTSDDPFANPPGDGADDPFADGDDPFGEAPADDTGDEANDPFGEAPADDADDPFGEAPADDTGDPAGDEANDPFGEAPADDADDPFGEAPADDTGDPAGDDADDPFGDQDATNEPADDNDDTADPFGDDEPFADEDDPFADQ